MLSAEQVHPFIQHHDSAVRRHAVDFFTRGPYPGVATAQDVLLAFETYGLGPWARLPAAKLSKLPWDGASFAQLIDLIGRVDDDVMRFELLVTLRDIPFDVLSSNADRVFSVAALPPAFSEHLEWRLAARAMTLDEAWQQLFDHSDEYKWHSWFEFDHRIHLRLLEVLERYGQDAADLAMARLIQPEENGWMPIFSLDLLGRLRYRPALPLAVELLETAGDYDDALFEQCERSIARIGGVDAIAAMERVYIYSDSGTKFYAAGILGQIKASECESALIRLLDAPQCADTRFAICDALFDICTTDGIDRLYDLERSVGPDWQGDDLGPMLHVLGVMINRTFPESEEYKRRSDEDERGFERELSKDLDTFMRESRERTLAGLSPHKPRPIDELDGRENDLDASAQDDDSFYPELPGKLSNRYPLVTEPIKLDKAKIGRNDPCPCGSGKKYKKCCLGKA